MPVPIVPHAGLLTDLYELTMSAAYWKAGKSDEVATFELSVRSIPVQRSFLLAAGFVPVRKPGKLPADIHEVKYELEYGSGTLAVHQDAIAKGERVLLVDDLLATGGTMAAAVELIRKMGGVIVGVAFLVELGDLGGRKKLPGIDIVSMVTY